MKRYIRCQAKHLSDIGADLEQHTPPVIQALIQLYLYPYVTTTEHWRQEVWANLHSVDLRKGTNKLPKRDFILKNTIVPNRIVIKIVPGTKPVIIRNLHLAEEVFDHLINTRRS